MEDLEEVPASLLCRVSRFQALAVVALGEEAAPAHSFFSSPFLLYKLLQKIRRKKMKSPFELGSNRKEKEIVAPGLEVCCDKQMRACTENSKWVLLEHYLFLSHSLLKGKHF